MLKTLSATIEITDGTHIVTNMPRIFDLDSESVNVEIAFTNGGVAYSPAGTAVIRMYTHHRSKGLVSEPSDLVFYDGQATGVMSAPMTAIAGTPNLFIMVIEDGATTVQAAIPVLIENASASTTWHQSGWTPPADGLSLEFIWGTGENANKLGVRKEGDSAYTYSGDLSGQDGAVSASDNNPLMNGTASPGTSGNVSREDHVHPSDTTRASSVDGIAPTGGDVPLKAVRYMDTIPAAVIEHLGLTVAYTGATDATYTNGHLYLCQSDGGSGYEWAHIGIALSGDNPVMDGVASPGDSSEAAKANHRHPSDTSRVAKTTLTSKGDIFVATTAGTITRLAVGADDMVLIADSSEATGLKWVSWLDYNYPVNTIVHRYDTTSPAALYGGTWALIAEGKTLVGVDTGDTDFNVVGETGGSKTQAYDLSENGWANTFFSQAGGYIMSEQVTADAFTANNRVNVTVVSESTSKTQGAALGGATDEGNNMPPYVAVYIWRRTA